MGQTHPPNCSSTPSNGYDAVGNVVGYSETNMTTNGATSDGWGFAYDTLNRLATASTSQAGNPDPNYCWSYDSFGNRLNQTSSSLAFASGSGGAAACTLQSGAGLGQNNWALYNGTVNGTNNNQMSATSQNPNQGQYYDASGDVSNDGVNQYLYDGEGRLCAEASTPVPGMTTMTGYVYDAEGYRVAKGTLTQFTCDFNPADSTTYNGFTTTNSETDYVLGPGGQVTELAEDANGTMNWQRTYVYAAGALIATYDPVSNPQFNQAQYNPSTPTVDPPIFVMPSFRLTDWLGTMRATTDANGVWQGGCTGLPYGDGMICSNSPDPRYFTGKERDQESGNDYFGARYYASSMGRWLSPDWSAKIEPVPYAKLDDPQSLNLYVYLFNNPVTGVDVDGHTGCDDGSTACWLDNNGHGWAVDQAEATTAFNQAVAQQQSPSCPSCLQVESNHPLAHWWNKLGSWLSSGFSSLSAVFSRSFGSFGGARAGKPFTPGGKQTVLNRNAAENGGTNVCENCGQPTVPGQQSQAGVPRPGNESNVDHIYPRSLGGDGDPINGQNLCATCNGIKSNSLPVMEEPEVMPEIPIEIPIIP